MAKFIITGDLHYRAKNPVARTDLYIDALNVKISEIFDLAEQHKAEAILIPGDIFDSPTMSLPTIKMLARKFISAPCPVITIPGNHDGFGHNLESLPRTPYSLLADLDYIRCVHNKYWGWTDTKAGLDGIITGYGHNSETDNDLQQYCFNVEADESYRKICNSMPSSNNGYNPFRIHMVHGMLLDEAPGIDFKHTLVSQLEEIPEHRRPHVLVCGHYHFGLKLQYIGKTLVINPGAIGRLTAHMEEMERQVKVTLLTVHNTDEYEAETIALKMAQPGHEVLSRKHIEEKQERNKSLEEFLGLLAQEGEAKFLEVTDIIEDIASREDMPKEVQDVALSRLSEARETLGVREIG